MASCTYSSPSLKGDSLYLNKIPYFRFTNKIYKEGGVVITKAKFDSLIATDNEALRLKKVAKRWRMASYTILLPLLPLFILFPPPPLEKSHYDIPNHEFNQQAFIFSGVLYTVGVITAIVYHVKINQAIKTYNKNKRKALGLTLFVNSQNVGIAFNF